MKTVLYARNGYPYHKATTKEILSAICVKPLKWEIVGLARHSVAKPNTIYTYMICQRSGSYVAQMITNKESKGMDFPTIEQAKEACEKHHKQCVLSMITEAQQ